jgi:hypothetical protein
MPCSEESLKSRSYLKIPGAGKVIQNNFHTGNPKILHAIVVAWELRRPDFVHPDPMII